MNGLSPVLVISDGTVRANSRDIAASFDKEHRDVLRAIDNLTAQEPDLGLRNFAQGSYTLPMTGEQSHRCFDMDRDGFTLLAMGFTGPKALKWKLAYIEAFNMMEAELRARPDPIVALNDPNALRGLLLTYSEKVIALESANAELTPKAEALDRIATADGSFNVTGAAKALQMRPKDLFAYLQAHNWIYRRPGGAGYLGYQAKVTTGLVEHKVTTVLRGDGSEKIVEQVLITAKGLTKLAALMRPAAQAA